MSASTCAMRSSRRNFPSRPRRPPWRIFLGHGKCANSSTPTSLVRNEQNVPSPWRCTTTTSASTPPPRCPTPDVPRTTTSNWASRTSCCWDRLDVARRILPRPWRAGSMCHSPWRTPQLSRKPGMSVRTWRTFSSNSSRPLISTSNAPKPESSTLTRSTRSPASPRIPPSPVMCRVRASSRPC